MSPVAVSADRRFRRAHVKPSRRRGAWRTFAIVVMKYGLTAALVMFVVTRGMTFLSTSTLLRVDSISPSGNQRMSGDAVRSMLDGLRGENILFVDLEEWRSRLLESPWVRDASLRRSLPSTVEVTVQERTPIAIGRMAGRLYLVDERGTVIDEYGPHYATLDLPIVDGFGATGEGRDGKDGKDAPADAARAALAARLIMALRQKPAVANRLSQVDVSDAHNVSIILSDDPAELRVGDDHFLARVESYLSLSDALHERVPEIDYVDLRFDGRVYVRPAGKAGKGTGSGEGRSRVNRVNDAGRHQ
jgi:cell division protein FtsQ